MQDPLEALEKIGVLHKGHFVFTSQLHSAWYVRIDKGSYKTTQELSGLCRQLALLSDDSIQVVVGPATGGSTIANLVAGHLSALLNRKIPFISLEKSEEAATFAVPSTQIHLLREKSILLVDDVLTTGMTLRRAIAVLRSIQGKIIGVSVIWNRGPLYAQDLNIPWLYALVAKELPSYPEDECPLCAQGIPVNTEMGHGSEFMSRKAPRQPY